MSWLARFLMWLVPLPGDDERAARRRAEQAGHDALMSIRRYRDDPSTEPAPLTNRKPTPEEAS